MEGEPAFSQNIEGLFCFANSQNAHYLCIISSGAQINELPNPSHNKAHVRMARLKGASLEPFDSTTLEIHRPRLLLCVILMNARSIFTECKCEEVEIHLDFWSPSEFIRGGSVSIR